MKTRIRIPSFSTRRSFLKTMLAAGTAPLFVRSHVLGAAGQTRPSNKINVGVIGVGAQGFDDMRNFLGQNDARVTAICDVNRRNIEKARQQIAADYGRPDVKVFSDFRELNADPSIDAVLMALPVHWHSAPALDAILHGKHLFHEKPMALSFEEGRRVRAAIRKKGVVFQFGTQQRSDLKFRWACELALNGRLGKIKEIQVWVYSGSNKQGIVYPEQPVPDYVDWNRWVGPAPATTFHEDKLKRGNHENMAVFSLGMIQCWGIHHLDIAQWGNGVDATGPRTVQGTGTFPGKGDLNALQHWRVRFDYEKAAPVTFTSKPSEGAPNGIKFIGETGWIWTRRGILNASDENILRDPQNKYDTMPITLPISADHTRDFLDAIKQARRPISDVETAMRSDTLCQLAHIAVKQGRKLHWDPNAERFINDDAANAMLQPRPRRGDWKLPEV